MDNEIIKIASTQGIWATLAVALIFYIIRNQEKRDIRQEERETKYQHIIEILSDKLNILDDIRADMEVIKEHLNRFKITK